MSANPLSSVYNYLFPARNVEEKPIRQPQEDMEDYLTGSRMYSQIDSEKEMTLEMWAVSMLIDKGKKLWNRESTQKITNLVSYHTILIIEGVEIHPDKEGRIRQFWQKAHLRGPSTCGDVKAFEDCYSGHSNIGKVEILGKKYRAIDLTRYKSHRQTWTVPSDKVNSMIERIQYEEQHPEETPFRFMGENSLFSTKKLLLKIQIFKLLQVYKDDQNLAEIVTLFQESELRKNQSFLPELFLLSGGATAIYQGIIQASRTSTGGVNLVPAIQKMGATKWIPAICALPALYSAARRVVVMYKSHKNQENLELMNDYVEKITLVSHNCFSWAREKLGMLDEKIAEEIGERPTEKLGILPICYLPHKE